MHMLSVYDEAKLKEEDAYDDSEYQAYETMDYTSEDEETKEQQDEEKTRALRKRLMNQEDELFDFYKTDAKIKKGMESKEFYAQLAKTVREKTGNERKEAMESACFYMKGLVRDFIFKRYMTYIERDPEYKEDLEHEAYKAIMENLPRYDATKGAPSTFFYYHIKSALSHTTTTNKHQMTQADAVLKKKILKIRAEYEKLGKKPTEADYMLETDETLSQIRNALRQLNMDFNTHLEAIPQHEQLIAGNPEVNTAFETPERATISKMMLQAIVARMHQLFTDEECEIYLRHTLGEETVPTIVRSYHDNKSDDCIRRIIEKIGNDLSSDPVILSLRGGKGAPDLNVIQFVPMEGTKQNVNTLAALPL